ncbi:MAG TPA: response regulator transcription factor [Solirubrobacteraceae bacterium]|nr:response regulator transcription factor [Solirubrobacteraceae bacterium]
MISAGDLSKRIGQVLEQEELVFDIFDDVETLLTGEAVERNPTSIVLWIEDTVVGLACCIEPLTSTFARVPLVVVCASIERWGVRAALSAGAAGVVLSDDLDSALGPCLQAVRSGQICVPRAYGRQIEPPILSSREKQILGLVVMSYTNGQIARQLFLAESTVKSHLSSAFRKLGVRSRYEAVSIIVGSERGLGMGVISLVGGDESASGRVPSPEAVCMNSMQHR